MCSCRPGSEQTIDIVTTFPSAHEHPRKGQVVRSYLIVQYHPENDLKQNEYKQKLNKKIPPNKTKQNKTKQNNTRTQNPQKVLKSYTRIFYYYDRNFHWLHAVSVNDSSLFFICLVLGELV